MELKSLRVLVAIADHSNFSAAGEAIGLTQSAVSLHIKSLEEEFGAALFDKTKRRYALVP
jgi:DNA-binding transcriptional LysR family regulator